MSDALGGHVHRTKQRRVLRASLAFGIVGLLIFIPLIVFSQFRLDLAYRLGLAPGEGVEQIASANDDVSLIVIPFKAAGETASDPYRNRAQFLATTSGDGTDLKSLTTNHTIHILLGSIDFVAASNDGSNILLREGSTPSRSHSVLIDVTTDAVSELPVGTLAPDLAGDWQTPVWQKTSGRCGPRSVTGIYVACLPRAALATYLAGDWQLNLQIYGNYQRHQDVFRGMGFLPTIGFAANDTVVYLENERGIWRADIDPAGFST